MKIFTAGQIRDCDAYTIKTEGITSLQLMERAATACYKWITKQFNKETSFIVLCGNGNNGGDGLALTRLLLDAGFNAEAFVLEDSSPKSADHQTNFERLKQKHPEKLRGMSSLHRQIEDSNSDVVFIDALFGTGLSRPIDGAIAELIQSINKLPNCTVAIDIPSGLMADKLPESGAAVIQADHTLSFQFYKRSFLHVEGGYFVGEGHILDIGLSEEYIRNTHSSLYVLDKSTIEYIIKKRDPFSHKGTFGTALLVAGSYGMMGAAVLSTMAALRSGVGKATAWVPGCGYDIIQSTAYEATCITTGNQFIEGWIDLSGYNSIGVGPGLGTEPETFKTLEWLLTNVHQPIVLDADALNMLARNPGLMNIVPKGSILTPHPGEFRRLFGESKDSMFMLDKATEVATEYDIIIILKGRYTGICTPDGNCCYNTTGNSGLATGGSGDVLTGLITGLLAQGYGPEDASKLGVYLHGVAGDLAAEKMGSRSIIARDIMDQLGPAFSLIT